MRRAPVLALAALFLLPRPTLAQEAPVRHQPSDFDPPSAGSATPPAAPGTAAPGSTAAPGGAPPAGAPATGTATTTDGQPPPAPGTTPTTTPGSAQPPGTPAPTAQPVAAVIDAAPIGVDPAAATFVTDILREATTQAGFAPVATPQLYEAARSLQLPFPVPPDGVLALMRRLDAVVGVTAEVRGGGGYYQVTVRVRLPGEPSERVRQLVATQWTLGDQLRTVIPALLTREANAASQQQLPGWEGYTLPALPDMTNVNPPTQVRPSRLHPQRFEIAAGLEFAIGPGGDPFWNFLGYVRGAWFPHDRFGITASVAYANLRGRTRRVSNVLPMIGVETAVEIVPRQRIYLPLRAEVGYLPSNGVVFRATAGLAFFATRNIRIEFDILSPTVWVLPEATPVSLDVGVQIIYGIGGPTRRRARRTRTNSTSTTSSTSTSSSSGSSSEASSRED